MNVILIFKLIETFNNSFLYESLVFCRKFVPKLIKHPQILFSSILVDILNFYYKVVSISCLHKSTETAITH